VPNRISESTTRRRHIAWISNLLKDAAIRLTNVDHVVASENVNVKPILAIGLSAAAVLASAAPAQSPKLRVEKALPPVFDVAAIDRNVDPCVDFYQYACGAWLAATPIPADQQIWWRSSELDEHIRATLATLLEEAAARGAKRENRRKLGDYYGSCLDQAAIDAKGLKPFAPELERIAAIKDKSELARVIAHLHLIGAAPLFSFFSSPDYTNGSMMIAAADQGGFALPDRDYYWSRDFKIERAAYREHLKRMFVLLGDSAEVAGEKPTR
jgi:endothelin-converting enzyme/putative endopeptidase